MPGYPTDEPPVSRSRDYRHDRRPPRDYDDYEDDLYRRPSTKSRDPTYPEPRTSTRQRRRDTYDASDEDEYVPRRRHREDRTSPKEKAQAEPDIPPPPIGDERKEYTSSRRHRGDDLRAAEPTAHPVRVVDGADRDDGYADEMKEDRRRQRKHERRAYEEAESAPAVDDKAGREHGKKSSRSPYVDDPPLPPSDRKLRDAAEYDDAPIANERRQRKSGRSPYDEPEIAPVARKSSRRHRDEYDDIELPHRSKARDPYDAEPPRRRDPYAEPSRRREHRAAPVQDDSDDYEPPRRRRDDREKRRYEDGYGTDRPRRAARDDPYERGYRTDGRDAKYDRDRYADRRAPKHEDRRRDDRRRDDRYADEYDDPRDRRQGGKPRNGKHGFDVDGFMQKGQKTWQKAAPVAKPLLAQLANTYLNNGRGGGGVPH